jgi:omega-amidase
MTTGPAHWELLQRSRALDTQCYVAAVSIARNPGSSYTAWGHSTVVNPWGEVLATTEEGPATVYADLDMARVGAIRAQIPVSFQTRDDLYKLAWLGGGASSQ